jgi:hypothetical protein
MKLVIKGAYYYDRESETILIPHFTGEYCAVDCTKYIKLDELKESYDESFVNEVKDDFVEFEGEKYYYAEYSPCHIEDWELLSDLSDLEHIEQNFDF